MFRRALLITLFAAVSMGIASALPTSDMQRRVERVLDLIEQQRYADARQSLQQLRQQVAIDDETLHRHIDFGLAKCAYFLDDNDTESILRAFLRRYPESVHVNDVRFMLAMYYCEREEYKKAYDYFEKVSYKALTMADKERYNMRMGYIEFANGDYEKAYRLFSSLDVAGDYADHATYYKSYIHYHRGEYDVAKRGFKSLLSSDNYAKIIPYYLLQLEFASGNYDYVVKEGAQLMKQTVDVERTEIMRVVAESWYRLENYGECLLYILMYERSGGAMGREERYLLGYSAYRTTDYEKAIPALRNVCDGKDELSQNAAYHLADCYLRLGDKHQAIHAFAMAADAKLNNSITKEALFHYGRLLFETDGGAFNESINVLQRYIDNYPNDSRVDEVRDLLFAAFYNSGKYDLAYEAIKSFPNPDSAQKAALQKMVYANGLTAFKAGDYEQAKRLFAESQSIGVSPKYSALGYFWLGEIEYKLGNYAKAAEHYTRYTKLAPKSEREYRMALYNLGYSHFSMADMASSQRSFEGFLWLHKEGDVYRADALLRLGDVHYAQKMYAEAIKDYEGAIALGKSDIHHAKYQRAITFGLLGKTDSKIKALQQIYGEECGDYNDDVAYELGRTFVRLGRYDESVKVLEGFVESYPASTFLTPVLLDLGLVHFNLGNNDKSLHYYDKLITNDPRSAAAKEAIQRVREIYVAKGDVNAYFAYAERTGVECDLSAMARDSLSFTTAQKIYLSADAAKAIPQLRSYLSDYPKGYYTNDVLYYLSDSYLKCDSLEAAVESMQRLVERPLNQYTVQVVERLARETFKNAMYEASAKAYRRMYDVVDSAVKRVEATTGYATSILNRKDDEATMAMAQELDTLADVDSTMLRRVRFARAKVHTSREESAEARTIYEALSRDVSNVEGAESAYILIEMLFAEGKLDDSEKMVYALADSNTPHTYWLGKAFILLGDIYVARQDAFQARATYRSVIDGYTPADDGIIAEAQAKLDKLN